MSHRARAACAFALGSAAAVILFRRLHKHLLEDVSNNTCHKENASDDVAVTTETESLAEEVELCSSCQRPHRCTKIYFPVAPTTDSRLGQSEDDLRPQDHREEILSSAASTTSQFEHGPQQLLDVSVQGSDSPSPKDRDSDSESPKEMIVPFCMPEVAVEEVSNCKTCSDDFLSTCSSNTAQGLQIVNSKTQYFDISEDGNINEDREEDMNAANESGDYGRNLDKSSETPMIAKAFEATKSGDGTLAAVGINQRGIVQCPDCRQKFDSLRAQQLHWKFIHYPSRHQED